MKLTKILFAMVCAITMVNTAVAQDYYFKNQAPFNPEIPTPEAFLGYAIGEQHTRHDLIVAYLTELAEVSDRASIEVYGKTHERRKLVMFAVSTPENLNNLESIKQQHLKFVDPT